MKKYIRKPVCFLSLLALPGLAALPAKAQDEMEGASFWDRVFVGGSLGMQFGNLTFVDVSPLVGYKITEQLAAGIGGTYIYYRYRDSFGEFKTNMYGGRVFAKYYFIENLFAYTEYEILSMERPHDFNFNELTRVYIASYFVGGGYRQMLGSNAAIELLLLYNLTEEPYTPYTNPVIRIGVVAGF